MRLALYQPDIPQNVGSAIRLCACLGIPLDIIEPCGFIWDKRKIEQAALDYYALANIKKHKDWADFVKNSSQSRLVLMTTKASLPYTEFEFQAGDILIAGRESAGVPDEIHNTVQGRVYIPMHGAARSLNVINASSMVIGEALRRVKS